MIQQMKFCVCQRNSTKLGKPSKQAEKLKSREMKEGWMKDEWRMMKDEGWMMKDDDFKLLRGFDNERMDWRTNGHLWL